MVRRVAISILSLVALGAASAVLAASGQAARPGAPAVAGGQPAALPYAADRTEYGVFVQGVLVGNESLTVQRTDAEWTITGASRLQAPINLTLRQAEARYTLDLRPVRLVLLGQFRDQAIDLTTTFAGTTARNAFVQDGSPTETTAEVAADAVVLHSSFFGAYAALGARVVRLAPGATLPVYFAPQGQITAVLDAVSLERIQTASRTFAVRRHRLTFRNPGAPFGVEVETEEDGTLVRLTLPASQVQVVREDVASVAARQQSFFREGDEDVRVPGSGFTLAGTISHPPSPQAAGPRTKPARHPAIVLVAGSNAADRDQVIAGVPVLGQIAGGLADAGALVVRYDNRGVGQSGGRAESATLTDHAEDVISVVKWLADRKDVDGKRITVVGYGEGAWIALLAASREKRIARVALLAAAGTPGAELVLEQQQATLARSSLSDAEKERRVELQQRIHAAVLGERAWDGIPKELRDQADTPLFRSVLSFDPAKVLPRLRQPVLVLAAELDREVPGHHAQRLAELARARKKDAGVQLETLPGLNHLFVPARTGAVDEYASLPARAVSPAVADAITRWIAGK